MSLLNSLLDFRNTPSECIGSSPAQRCSGDEREHRYPYPKLLQPTALKGTDVSDKLHRAKQRQARNYDKVSKRLPPLTPGQNESPTNEEFGDASSVSHVMDYAVNLWYFWWYH
ncbi:uncharacterized protein LOC134178990 [Corticium candelabrum]|uniref:uncharacterized protein LOC134178990 n=1 Tax=Corticium candelabrum TaxID=121492 RepID=UPI002E25E080|nr:uncharacterized protein LOC134178990 [Corticium candelabrum]